MLWFTIHFQSVHKCTTWNLWVFGHPGFLIPLQVAGGTDFVRKTLGAFVPESVSTCLLADLHCYDGWVALAALEDGKTCYVLSAYVQ